MPSIDVAIIIVITISACFSLLRGFTRELISLLTWFSAFIIARMFGPTLAVVLESWISDPSMALVAAFAVLFVATLIVGAMIANLAGDFLKRTGLKGTDRLLGTVFGAARGGLIVLVLCVILEGAVKQYSWWKESHLVPYFLVMEKWSRQTFGAVFKSAADSVSIAE